MKPSQNSKPTKTVTLVLLLFLSSFAYTQNFSPVVQKSDFWNHVQFGAGFGLSMGSGYTNISLAPNAIYNFNKYVAAGIGLQGSYVSSKNNYTSAIYGASLIVLLNPIENIQLSAELEQLRVNATIKTLGGNDIKNNAWNTGLFLGAGYRMQNASLGVRYNVLYQDRDYAYATAFMPYVRVYF